MYYVREGLGLSKTGTIWELLFSALNHSLTLSNPESLNYLINTAIPKLLEHGQYYRVASYYETISDFYKQKANLELALEYKDLAIKILNKLVNNELRGF